MIAQRTTLRPKKSLARNWATARLTSTVSATTTTTQTTVLVSTVASEPWFRTLLKFAVPASPRRRPVIEYRLNAARTSWTAGKTTTPTISSSAGPSHSRAAHTEVSRLEVRRRGVDSLDTPPPATAGGTDAPGGAVDAAAATGIRPGSATASTSRCAIEQLSFSAALFTF